MGEGPCLKSILDGMGLRIAALECICGSDFYNEKVLDTSRKELARLLGFSTWEKMKLCHRSYGAASDELTAKLEALAGPYGFTVYKMLKVRLSDV